jgi:hypothetical protein
MWKLYPPWVLVGMPVATRRVQVPPWSVLMNRPTGSGAPPVPARLTYSTCTPAGLGVGDVGGAMASTTLLKPAGAGPMAAATTGVAPLRI